MSGLLRFRALFISLFEANSICEGNHGLPEWSVSLLLKEDQVPVLSGPH